jgi:predicted nuclease with TOPRIM domain
MQLELKRATQKTLSAEENAAKIDQLLTQEEYNLSRLQKELSQLKEKHFVRAQELFELRRKETSMEAELHGGKASLRNLGSKQHKLDEELLKQQEILYTQDFQLQQLRHKLGRMEGERTGEEMELLTGKIKVQIYSVKFRVLLHRRSMG